MAYFFTIQVQVPKKETDKPVSITVLFRYMAELIGDLVCKTVRINNSEWIHMLTYLHLYDQCSHRILSVVKFWWKSSWVCFFVISFFLLCLVTGILRVHSTYDCVKYYTSFIPSEWVLEIYKTVVCVYELFFLQTHSLLSSTFIQFVLRPWPRLTMACEGSGIFKLFKSF